MRRSNGAPPSMRNDGGCAEQPDWSKLRTQGKRSKTRKGSRYEMKNVLLLMADDMIPVIGNHREAHIVPMPNLDLQSRYEAGKG